MASPAFVRHSPKLILIAGLLFLTGCVSERDNGTSKVFTIELWISWFFLITGLVAAPLGYYWRESPGHFAGALMMYGPVTALGIAPSLFLNKTTVAADELTVRSGVWGLTGNYHVKYDNLNEVRHMMKDGPRRRHGGKVVYHYLVCDCKDGTSTKLSLSNHCVKMAAPHFQERVQAKGVSYFDERPPLGKIRSTTTRG